MKTEYYYKVLLDDFFNDIGAEETALDHDPLDLIEAHLVAPAIVELRRAGGRNLRAFGFGRIAEGRVAGCFAHKTTAPPPAPAPRARRGSDVRPAEWREYPFAGDVAAGARFLFWGRGSRSDSETRRGVWVPAFERVKELKSGWIGPVRPSRQPLCSFLRMR
jgi:hypothetical protein